MTYPELLRLGRLPSRAEVLSSGALRVQQGRGLKDEPGPQQRSRQRWAASGSFGQCFRQLRTVLYTFGRSPK
eukprot:4868422-Alexandrium_andersonii.AAC.1